jgi:tricorn protease
MPKGLNISGFDGDQSFSWSPDGRYIVIRSCNGFEGRSDIDVVKADGTEKPVNLTKSAFFNLNPKWGMGGKMIYYASTKTGLSNLTGFGQQDVFTLFLDRAAFEKYSMSNEDIELSTEHHRLDSLQHIRSTPKNFKGAIANSFQPDFNNLDDRSQRLTIASALISDDVLSPDGEKLYTLSSFGNNTDLWVTYPRTHDSKLLAKLNVDDGNLAISPDGKTLYLLSGDQLSKISTDDGSVSAISINGTMGLDKAKEKAYIFEHAYHIINRRFWDPNLHGVDFKYYYHEYARFLPHINNNYDFQLLLNEFLGELNSSHSGAGYRPSFPEGDQTAALGLLYDLNSSGNGLKVTSILKGGPFDNTETQINTGDVIEKIDGKPINADEDWAELLKFKAGKNTLISIYNPKKNQRWEETVKPISMATETENLLYKRWLHQMEHLTDSLSHGTIGYLHIREMDEVNFRATLETAVGKLTGKKAIIIDTRYNTGGGIHEELMALFTVDNTLVDRPQSRNLLNEGSTSGISKPTCVLISEGNYSDGFNFPYLYQERKAGKLIGMPAAGTGTGVWWERQIDSSLYFGIPQIGLSLPGTNQPLLEGHQLNPDILISNDYNKILNGRDQQLEAAVNELLKQ